MSEARTKVREEVSTVVAMGAVEEAAGAAAAEAVGTAVREAEAVGTGARGDRAGRSDGKRWSRGQELNSSSTLQEREKGEGRREKLKLPESVQLQNAKGGRQLRKVCRHVLWPSSKAAASVQFQHLQLGQAGDSAGQCVEFAAGAELKRTEVWQMPEAGRE
ncbi:unnamed protein product [Closterium sp. Naga37s-1]|nr:unnamed protein product [Closterium sp. Naga37s-1]